MSKPIAAWAKIDENGDVEKEQTWHTCEIYQSLHTLLDIWVRPDDFVAAKQAVYKGKEPVQKVVCVPIPNNCPENRLCRKPEDIHTCGACALRQPADTTAGTVVLCPYQDAFIEGSEG